MMVFWGMFFVMLRVAKNSKKFCERKVFVMAKNKGSGGKISPYAGNGGNVVKGSNTKKGGTGSGYVIKPHGK